MDGSVPGLAHESYHKSRRFVSGMPHGPSVGIPRMPLYNGGQRRDYHPNIHAPSAQSHVYPTGPDWESHYFVPSPQPKLFRPYPEQEPIDRPFEYEQARQIDSFLLKSIQDAYLRQSEMIRELEQELSASDDQFDQDVFNAEVLPEFIEDQSPEDLMYHFMNVSTALGHLIDVLPEEHPDIVNLRGAFRDIMDDPDALAKIDSLFGESKPSKLGEGDPYAIDHMDEAEQVFDRQLQKMEIQFDTTPQSFEEVSGLEETVQLEYDQIVDTEPRIPFEELMGEDSFSMAGQPSPLELEVDVMGDQIAEENLGPAGPLDAPGSESLDQAMMAYEDQAMEGWASDRAGNPSSNSNAQAPEFFASDPIDVSPNSVAPIGLCQEFYEELDATEEQAIALDPLNPHNAMPIGPNPAQQAQQIFDEQIEFMQNPFMPDMLAPPGVVPGL